MSSIIPQLRATARSLFKTPGFTLVAVFTLAVGIGANAALFTVVNAVLLRPLPFAEPERLVGVWNTAPGLNMQQFEHSDAEYILFRKYNRTLEDFAIYEGDSAALTGGETPEDVPLTRTTASLFSVLRARPILGRPLQEADQRPGAEPVAVLSYPLWQRRFGGERSVLGTMVRLDGIAHCVVGVMPEGFRYPAADTELWVPLEIDRAKASTGNFNYKGIGRLRPGATAKAAAKELSALIWRLPDEFGDSDIKRSMIAQARLAALVHPLRDDVVGDVERILWLLLGSVGSILLIACANVANLFLVRAESRQREVAVRTALGATRSSIARVFLSESLVLALVGGVLGLLLAAAGTRTLARLRPEGIPRLEEIGVDLRVVAFTVLLALLSGLLFGGIAVLRYGAPALVPALKEGGKGGTAGRGRHRARISLVVAQVALALVLLVGSGLMVKSFWKLRSVDPGIRPHGLLTASLSLPRAEYRDPASVARFLQQLLEKVRAIPGVESAGTVTILPLSGTGSNSGHTIEDHPLPPGAIPPILPTRYASPGYFETMGIPLIAGRTFDRLDPAKTSDGVVISQAMAERFWPGKSALGKRLFRGLDVQNRWFTVIGVVGSVRDQGLDDKPAETVYYSMRPKELGRGEDDIPHSFTLVVRSRGTDPAALAGPVRSAVWSLDRNLPVAQVRTMDEVVARSTARTTFTMLLLLIASAVALLLGAVGIYGAIAYVVSQRTREIGVRMALGARRRDISKMVLREGFAVAVLGIVIGLAGALALTRVMVALLFEVSPTDPATFTAVPLVLGTVALLASYFPAQRAAAVEPLEAIRYE
jgi:predicted permease